MATELHPLALAKTSQVELRPQCVLKIEGVPTIFGQGTVKKYVRIGDENLYIGDDWVVGGLGPWADQKDLINIEEGFNTITQQLIPEKGTSSTPGLEISLIDDGSITELISGFGPVDDVLGRRAEFYVGFQDTPWPQSFLRVFYGVIEEVKAGVNINFVLAHPESRKRGEIFNKVTTKLSQVLNFESAIVQKVLYQTRPDIGATVTVTYTGGGTAGAEVVSVLGTAITVQIQNGVSKAKHIRAAIEKSDDAAALVDVAVVRGYSNEPQVVMAAVSLLSDTTIYVDSTANFIAPVPSEGLRTYVRVEDEIIEYTGKTATSFTGCTREALVLKNEKARGDYHAAETTVDSYYRIEGNSLDLALKIMLSGGAEYFGEDTAAKSLGYVEGIGSVNRAIYFEGVNIQDSLGLTIGDFVVVEGDTYPSNDGLRTISDIIETLYGSYLIVDGAAFIENTSSPALCKFKSKYNVWGVGLGLDGNMVDVPEFERIKETFYSSILPYDRYLKDTEKADELINTELLASSGAYTVPRKGKISVGYSAPPLGVNGYTVIDETSSTNPTQNKLKRSINQRLYNAVVFTYNEDAVDNKMLSGDVTLDLDSKAQIPISNKVLTIRAKGLRPSTEADTAITILKDRYLDRYRFGAESLNISGFYGDLFNKDVGDIVMLKAEGLKLPDTKSGSRKFKPRLFEIQNKAMNIETGKTDVFIVDTGYSIENGRFGIISPSSVISTGLSTSSVILQNSFGWDAPKIEKQKWVDLIGTRLIIHSDDWTVSGETKLAGFNASNDYNMLFDPPLVFTPIAGYIVDIAPYEDTDDEIDTEAKALFCYSDPAIAVATGISGTQFTVAPADIGKMQVGQVLLVRSSDWLIYSPEVIIDDITGVTVTVDESLGFTPTSTYVIELVGFNDGGAPYRFI